jgi:hypothetical protein
VQARIAPLQVGRRRLTAALGRADQLRVRA